MNNTERSTRVDRSSHVLQDYTIERIIHVNGRDILRIDITMLLKLMMVLKTKTHYHSL